jgi:signal transduction histidine kinase
MQRKIIIAIILTVVIISTGVWIIGHLIVDESIDRSLKDRLTLAGIIAKNIDLLLERNLNRLYDISLSGKIDIGDNDWGPEKEALRAAYQYSIFTDGIFLLDRKGNVVQAYPQRLNSSVNLMSVPYVSSIINEGRPAISDIYTVEPKKKKVIYAMVPLRSKEGDIVGVAGGEIDPTNLRFNEIIKSVTAESNTYMEIVDSHGIIIASNNPKRIFTDSDHNKFLQTIISERKPIIRTCHRCHLESVEGRGDAGRSTDILAFAPLETVHWGVSIVQPEKDIFAPARRLNKTILAISIGSIGIALIIAMGMSKSIVKPIHRLIDATHKITTGDLSAAIEFGGRDEIGKLSSSFEIMRLKLSDSLEGLHQYNVQLEEKVLERTKRIKESHEKVENLLKKVMSVQEEERKRIARGLHDDTMQSLSALLMKMKMFKAYPEQISVGKINEMEKILFDTLDGIHNIIQNLRPSVLDDLGLESAVRWLLDRHLGDKGITYFFNVLGEPEKRSRLTPGIEISLFRIIQEAVINIARHASAENVFIILKYLSDSMSVCIEDDGCGIDLASVLKNEEEGRGLGILGMKERVYLLDGRFQICSMPDSGTRIDIWIPLTPNSGANV